MEHSHVPQEDGLHLHDPSSSSGKSSHLRIFDFVIDLVSSLVPNGWPSDSVIGPPGSAVLD